MYDNGGVSIIAGLMDRTYERALKLKEQLAQALTTFFVSILTQPRGRQDEEETAEPPLRQVIDVLQQVMCAHDAEKVAISVLEVYEERKSPKQPTCYE